MDGSASETYGQQEGTAYNGHFGRECYHPLFVFNQDGDVEFAKLRPGNVASADDWRSVPEPVIERYRDLDICKFFRGDAAFAIPELYEFLEAEGYRYAIRLKANPILEKHISHLLVRPVGRPPKKPQMFYHSFDYPAQSWDQASHPGCASSPYLLVPYSLRYLLSRRRSAVHWQCRPQQIAFRASWHAV